MISKDSESKSHFQGKKPNRLIHEKSPYLLQHAYNPLDWYAWGEEAFEKARKGKTNGANTGMPDEANSRK